VVLRNSVTYWTNQSFPGISGEKQRPPILVVNVVKQCVVVSMPKVPFGRIIGPVRRCDLAENLRDLQKQIRKHCIQQYPN
jgi:hypothetical protein